MTDAAAALRPSLESTSISNNDEEKNKGSLRYVQYELEREHVYLDAIRKLISKDLSEPYSIYVYRYFLNQWGDLCYMVRATSPPTSLWDD